MPLGRYIRDTGLAVPFVVLFFMSIWGLPLITALVAGDIVASESHNGTLKTILTRSRDRGEVFAGKVLATATYTLAVVFAMGVVGLVAGSIAWGFHPLTSLSGHEGRARPRAAAARSRRLAIYTLPLAGIAAFGVMLSTVTRNSAASVVGALMWALLMQLLGVLPGTESIRPVPARDAVRRLARPPPHPGRLDADRRARSGSAPSTSASRSSPPTSSSCGATSPATDEVLVLGGLDGGLADPTHRAVLWAHRRPVDITSRITDRLAAAPADAAKRVEAELAARIPVGRLGEPIELGHLVAFLASEQASYITGAVLQVDGGIIMSNL